MKRRLLNLLIAGSLFLAGNGAVAGLLGKSTDVLIGGSLAPVVEVTTNSSTVGAGIEYELCVNGNPGCTVSGLKILMDIGDTGVQFTFSRSTGPVGGGDTFSVELDFLGFGPADSLSGVNVGASALDRGKFGPTSVFTDFVVFEGNEAGDLEIAVDREATLSYTLIAVPEPGVLALLPLALVSMGVRRRSLPRSV